MMRHKEVALWSVALLFAALITSWFFFGHGSGEKREMHIWPWDEREAPILADYVPAKDNAKTSLVRKFYLVTKDGLRRPAVLFLRAEAKGNVVMCHPASYDKDFMLPFVRYVFDKYNCLIFDFRRHGREQDRQYSTIGRDEFYEVEAAVEFLKNTPETKNLPMFGFGISMGAATLIEAEARKHMFDALIVQAPFADIIEQVLRMKPRYKVPGAKKFILSKVFAIYTRRKFKVVVKQVAPKEAIKRVKVPVFLIHARDDKVVGFDSFEKIYENGKHCISKTWTPQTGGHTELLIVLPKTYRKKCNRFLDAVLRRMRETQEEEEWAREHGMDTSSFMMRLFTSGAFADEKPSN